MCNSWYAPDVINLTSRDASAFVRDLDGDILFPISDHHLHGPATQVQVATKTVLSRSTTCVFQDLEEHVVHMVRHVSQANARTHGRTDDVRFSGQ